MVVSPDWPHVAFPAGRDAAPMGWPARPLRQLWGDFALQPVTENSYGNY